MPLDHTTLYFNTLKRRDGKTVFVLLHASTGLALTMAEALKVEGLPDGFSLDRHPALPGRAGWIFDGEPLKAGFTLVRAGFSGSREEAGQIAPAPATGVGSGKVIDVEQRGGMTIARIESNPAPYEPEDPDGYLFNIATRIENDTPVPRILVAAFYKNPKTGATKIAKEVDTRFPEDSPGLVLPECVVADSDRRRFRGTLSEAEVVVALEAAGLTRDTRLWLWLEPSEASFGVIEQEDEPLWLSVFPQDEDCPFFDDMRDDHFKAVPDWLGDNLMENTWEINPEMTREAVIADMTARGYTYDPELETL